LAINRVTGVSGAVVSSTTLGHCRQNAGES